MIAERPPRAVAPIFEEMRRRYRAAPFPPLAERRANLARLARAIEARRGEIDAALLADLRKPAYESEFTEVILTLTEIKHARASLAKWMRPRPVPAALSLFGAAAEVRYEPKGVALVLAPWNYPFQLAIAPLVAALAAGCRVVVRPSEKAPHTRAVIEALLADAFEPHDVAFAGGEIETAQALLALPFDHIFFTGSTHVGKLVMRAAADHLASVTLELGGKSPCIVDADADIAWAAKRIAWGKFINAGQTCVAPDYVLVHRSCERALIDALKEATAAMYGDSDDARAASPDFCRIIDDGHFERVTGLLDRSIAAGACVEFGGKRDRAARYIAPTVLSGVSFAAPIMSEEIFGPVLPVLAYDTLGAALAEINRRPKPLALYVFCAAPATVERVLAGTSAGATVANDTVLHWAHPNLPVGGVGESGTGSYHGYYGFKAFSHERAVMRQSKTSLAPLLAAPYGAKTKAMLAVLERLP